MEKIDIDLSAYKFVIVNPGIHVSTAWAFAQIVPQQPKVSIKNIIHQPVSAWKDVLINDFEESVMKQFSTIREIKEDLYNAGAAYVSMSGSGSTVYGIFEKNSQPALHFPKNYFTQIL